VSQYMRGSEINQRAARLAQFLISSLYTPFWSFTLNDSDAIGKNCS
jgi:hypothetical protein